MDRIVEFDGNVIDLERLICVFDYSWIIKKG